MSYPYFSRLMIWRHRHMTAVVIYRVVNENYATLMLPRPDGHRSPVVITDRAVITELTLAARARFDPEDAFFAVLMARIGHPSVHITRGTQNVRQLCSAL